MSKKLYKESNIQSIANAIREKNGTENSYRVSDMAEAILDLPTISPRIQPLYATQNGTYNPPSGVDGYAPVTVNMSGFSPGEILFHQSIGQASGAEQFIAGEITIQKAGTYLLYGGGWVDTDGAIIEINGVAIEQITMGGYSYFVYSTPVLSQGDVVSYNVGGSGRNAATVIIAFLHE